MTRTLQPAAPVASAVRFADDSVILTAARRLFGELGLRTDNSHAISASTKRALAGRVIAQLNRRFRPTAVAACLTAVIGEYEDEQTSVASMVAVNGKASSRRREHR